MWSDYLCPWCYVGLDRIEFLHELRVTVSCLPYQLHPEIPPGGLPRRRSASVYDRVAAECRDAALPFRPPEWIPGTRLTLEAAELVRRHHADAFDTLHRSLFAAYFVEGRDIGSPAVVDELVAAAGADPEDVRRRVAAGHGSRALEESMAAAAAADVTGTPAWLVEGMLIPGAQPRQLFERIVTRIRQRAADG